MRHTLLPRILRGLFFIAAGAFVSVCGATLSFSSLASPEDGAPEAMLFQMLGAGTIALGLGPVAAGVVVIAYCRSDTDAAFAESAGLDAGGLSSVLGCDLRVIIPRENRRANPAVAAASVRVLDRCTRRQVRSFARITNTLLTPTDAAALFGGRLDEFVFQLSQKVEHAEDRDIDSLLAVVRDGGVAPGLCIEYLRVSDSLSTAIVGMRSGLAPQYMEAFV